MKLQLPEKLYPLFEPKRYKVVYSGRGAGKSWGIGRSLLVLGRKRSLRIVCARETLTSIDESVYTLLVEQIQKLGLIKFYIVTAKEIIGLNGTRFTFHGLQNPDSLKSLEGCDILWVEEAHAISEHSWETVIPTVRKDYQSRGAPREAKHRCEYVGCCSEIWLSFNPRYEHDPTYVRFIKEPPDDATVIFMNYLDNPWFPSVLEKASEQLRARDIASWEHVYGGKCRQQVKGALWTQQLIEAGRVTANQVPPWMIRIVVAIDPSVTANENSDECGIGVVGLDERGHVYVFQDLSCVATPLEWAKISIAAYRSRRADRIVGEVNNGGDLVARNISAVDASIPFRAVHASRGKIVRAEPVVALYEQGRVHHVGNDFAKLEHQMATYVPGIPKAELKQRSPDRMDWLVWGVTDLVLDLEPVEETAYYDSGYQISVV